VFNLLISLVELCKDLKGKILTLEEKNKALEIENTELKERLSLNSRNSSIPSSKELYKMKENMPKNKTENGRKVGGQVGHKGSQRATMEANEVVKIELFNKCECGGEILICKEPYAHQKVDLPEIKPYVVEYQLEHGRCRKCGKRKSSKLPREVTSDTFGPRVKSVISALSGFYKNSKREIANIMKDIFNLNISIGSVSNSERRVASKCKEAYERVEEEVKASKVLHIDETSHFTKGKVGWCWMFTNNEASFVKLADSRGRKFLTNSTFSNYKNLVVTDRLGVYNHFSDEKRQICWAHLLRDFERISNSWNKEVQCLGNCLKDATIGLFALNKYMLKGEIDVSKFISRAKELRRYIWYCLTKISYILEGITGSKRYHKI
jgi:transposase